LETLQKRFEVATLDAAATLRNAFLFCAAAGLCWWAANDFSVAAPDGFDPLRYEYYARYGLPEAFSDSSSYRMVLVLQYIYEFLPFYMGYLALMAGLCFGLRYFDPARIVSIAIYSPISFYYVSQTGKDGIAVLAAIAAAIFVTSRKNIGMIALTIFVVGLAFYIRPAIILIVPVVIVQFRYGTYYAIISAVFLSFTFIFTSDSYSILSNLEGLTGDEGAGQFAQLLRRFTFGYELGPVIAKLLLLSVSVFFQPILGILKFYAGSPFFVLFEGLSFLAFLILVAKDRLVVKFVISSLPYVVTIGVSSPFYHFRYLAVAYPVIWAYSRYSDGWGFRATRFKVLHTKNSAGLV
jgi:hypothetical protein